MVFFDNCYVEGSSTPLSRTDAAGNTYQSRRLDDGSTHEVLKNFPAKKALVEMKRDPVLTESARIRVAEDDETYRVDHELSDGETPEALLASKEIASAVNASIEALSEDLRQAITLREIEGLSYEEIAEVMNCPIGTVRSRIFRAREAIAQRLRPLLDTREGERW